MHRTVRQRGLESTSGVEENRLSSWTRENVHRPVKRQLAESSGLPRARSKSVTAESCAIGERFQLVGPPGEVRLNALSVRPARKTRFRAEPGGPFRLRGMAIPLTLDSSKKAALSSS